MPAQREGNWLFNGIDESRSHPSLFTPLEQDIQCFGILLSPNHCTHTRPNDRSFFSGDTRNRVAEILLMVQRDLCDGDYVCVCSGRGIEAATQACFQDRELDPCITKSEQGNRSYLLEKSRQRFELFRNFADASCAIGKLFAGYLDAGDFDSFCN